MKINEQALNDIIGRLERSWQGDARRAIKRLYELLDKGITTEQAVNKIKKEFPALFALTGLQDAMVEAAAYGYGIMPSILTKAEKATLARSLALAWTSDKMTLSEKIHGLGVRMRDQIVQTINEQLDKNATWKEASLALYDGYTGGGDIIKPQEVPQYIQKVIDAAKDAAGDEKEIAKQAEQAARQAEQLAKNGAPTTALQAAYNQVVEAAESGSQEALEKAIDVAVNEKSRYVADRIIRTETARAYNNGFLSKVMADDDVVALRWKLNTRHPVFDICDMFAKADMFGLGPGIFPKDNLPRTSIPVHPHCMCRFVEVYDGEVDMDKMVDRTQEAGEEWLKKLNDQQQRLVLGVQGQKQFAKDGSWQESMRGWFGTGKPDFTDLSKNLTIQQLDIAERLAEDVKLDKQVANTIVSTIDKYEKELGVKLFNRVEIESLPPDDNGHAIVFQTIPEIARNPSVVLKINKDFFNGVGLEAINESLKQSQRSVCDNLEEAVIHEIGHARLINGLRPSQVSSLYKELENTHIDNMTPIAYIDGSECIAEMQVYFTKGKEMEIPQEAMDLWNKYILKNQN